MQGSSTAYSKATGRGQSRRGRGRSGICRGGIGFAYDRGLGDAIYGTSLRLKIGSSVARANENVASTGDGDVKNGESTNC